MALLLLRSQHTKAHHRAWFFFCSVLWVITYQRLLSFICRNVTAKIRIMNIYFPYLIVAMSFVDKSMSNMMGVDNFKQFQSYSHRISIFCLNASLNYVKSFFFFVIKIYTYTCDINFTIGIKKLPHNRTKSHLVRCEYE